MKARPGIAAAMLLACSAMAPAQATVTRTGTLNLKVTATAEKIIPDGTTVNAYVSVAATNGNTSTSNAVLLTATVANGAVIVAVPVLYVWELPAASASVTVSVYLSANITTGSGTVYYSSSLGQSIALPTNNAKTNVTLKGTL